MSRADTFRDGLAIHAGLAHTPAILAGGGGTGLWHLMLRRALRKEYWGVASVRDQVQAGTSVLRRWLASQGIAADPPRWDCRLAGQ